MRTSSGAYELNHDCAIITHQNEYPYFINAIKHGYIILFYFDFNTTVPLQYVALVFWKLMLTGCRRFRIINNELCSEIIVFYVKVSDQHMCHK